jgi:hypothetical protein
MRPILKHVAGPRTCKRCARDEGGLLPAKRQLWHTRRRVLRRCRDRCGGLRVRDHQSLGAHCTRDLLRTRPLGWWQAACRRICCCGLRCRGPCRLDGADRRSRYDFGRGSSDFWCGSWRRRRSVTALQRLQLSIEGRELSVESRHRGFVSGDWNGVWCPRGVLRFLSIQYIS